MLYYDVPVLLSFLPCTPIRVEPIFFVCIFKTIKIHLSFCLPAFGFQNAFHACVTVEGDAPEHEESSVTLGIDVPALVVVSHFHLCLVCLHRAPNQNRTNLFQDSVSEQQKLVINPESQPATYGVKPTGTRFSTGGAQNCPVITWLALERT